MERTCTIFNCNNGIKIHYYTYDVFIYLLRPVHGLCMASAPTNNIGVLDSFAFVFETCFVCYICCICFICVRDVFRLGSAAPKVFCSGSAAPKVLRGKQNLESRLWHRFATSGALLYMYIYIYIYIYTLYIYIYLLTDCLLVPALVVQWWPWQRW